MPAKFARGPAKVSGVTADSQRISMHEYIHLPFLFSIRILTMIIVLVNYKAKPNLEIPGDKLSILVKFVLTLRFNFVTGRVSVYFPLLHEHGGKTA